MLLIIRGVDSEILHEDNVLSVKIPTTNGSIQVLNNHAPMIGVIETGDLIYFVNEKEMSINISNGGIFSVVDDVVNILLSLHKF